MEDALPADYSVSLRAVPIKGSVCVQQALLFLLNHDIPRNRVLYVRSVSTDTLCRMNFYHQQCVEHSQTTAPFTRSPLCDMAYVHPHCRQDSCKMNAFTM